MIILILGLNYAPEPVGIGPYTAGMATSLAAAGHRVTIVTAKPYYPHWRVPPAFVGGGVRHSTEDDVHVIRVPIYVPAVPSGSRRLIHHASFALSALPVMLAQALRSRPDIVITIAVADCHCRRADRRPDQWRQALGVNRLENGDRHRRVYGSTLVGGRYRGADRPGA